MFMQGAEYPTSSSVLPFTGALAIKTEKPFKVNKQEVTLNRVVKAARTKMLEDVRTRFFGMIECKLEDYAVATVLDPRYKDFAFPGVNNWKVAPRTGSKLTKTIAVQWARQCWSDDWKPKEANATNPTKQVRC